MERRDAQNRTGASKALAVHYQLLSSYPEAEDVPYQEDALNFFRPPFTHQKQTGANKVTPTDNPFPSHFEYPGRLAGAPGALIFFCLLFFHQGKKRRSEDRQVTHPIRGTYKGAYAIRPYPAGRKKNRRPSGLPLPFSFKKTYTTHQPIPIKKINLSPSGLPLPIHFKKTYTSHQHIPIKKINRRPSGLPLPIHFKKTYITHQPIPIKKINLCPSGLPIPIHFSNIVHHTLCFSFK